MMNRVHTIIGWLAAVVLGFCFQGYATSDTTTDAPTPEARVLPSFTGDGYVIQEFPGPQELLYGFSPAPNGNIVAFYSHERCLIYTLGKSGIVDHGQAPVVINFRSAADGPSLFPRWIRGPNEENVFLLDPQKQRGVTLKDGKLVVVGSSDCTEFPKPRLHTACLSIAQGNPCPMEEILNAANQQPYRYFNDGYIITTSFGPKGDYQESKTLTVEQLRSVSNTNCRAVIQCREIQDRLVLVDFEKGTARPLDPQNGWSGESRYLGATFSPDGKWILGQFNHGHATKFEGPGYLHLFSADGTYTEQITAYSEECELPAARSYWLANGWIILQHHCTGTRFFRYDARQET